MVILMNYFVRSYYRSKNEFFYLSDVAIIGKEVKFNCISCLPTPCAVSTANEQLTISNFTFQEESRQLDLQKLETWEWLNTPCLSCRYLRRTDVNLWRIASGLPPLPFHIPAEYAQCDLRFEIGDKRDLITPCSFHCPTSSRPLSPPMDTMLQAAYRLAGRRLFEERDYGVLSPLREYKPVNSPSFLLPSEVSAFISLIDTDDRICGGSAFDSDPENILNPIVNRTCWCVPVRDFSLQDFYGQLMQDACNFLFSMDASIGICEYLDVAYGAPRYFVTGDSAKIQDYLQRKQKDKLIRRETS